MVKAVGDYTINNYTVVKGLHKKKYKCVHANNESYLHIVCTYELKIDQPEGYYQPKCSTPFNMHYTYSNNYIIMR